MRSWMRNTLAGGFLLAVVLGGATGQDPKGKSPDALYYSLRDVINHGAALFNNQGDYAGCYRLYEGALIAVRPQLTEHPELLKEIDETLKKADKKPRIVDRAFALRTALDHVRDAVRPKDLVEKKAEDKKPPEKKPEEKKPEDKKPEDKKPEDKKPEDKKPEDKKPPEKKPEEKKAVTLWDRLGGEANMTRAIADFVKMVADDPKVDVTRGGKFPLDDKKISMFERALVEMISEATGGPLKYEGKSMKAAHKGMGITNAEFDAAAADLQKALQNASIKKAEIDELMKIVDATRKDIVETKQPPPKKIEEKKEEAKKEEKKEETKKEETKKEEKALPDGTGKLSGKISLAGKTGTTGYITLIGSDQRKYGTFIRADGSYLFKTPLPPGEYQITVETFQKEGAPPLAERFPDRFLNPATSGLSVRVQPGNNAFDLDLE